MYVTGSGRPSAGTGLRTSAKTEKTIPSPRPTPRLALLSGVLGSACGRYSQMMLPDFASSAKTSCSPVVMYITPSFTTGDACCENPGPKPESRRAIHAPFMVFTLDG